MYPDEFPELRLWPAERKALAGRMGKWFSKMDSMISETMRDGIERGFVVCGDPRDPERNTVKECVGDSCQITLPECGKYDFHGTFHTHPTGSASLSIGDIAAAFAKNVDVACVGSRRDFLLEGGVDAEGNEVVCMVINRGHPDYERVREKVLEFYKREYMPVRNHIFERYRRGEDIEEEYRKKYSELRHRLMELIADVASFECPIGSYYGTSYRIDRLK